MRRCPARSRGIGRSASFNSSLRAGGRSDKPGRRLTRDRRAPNTHQDPVRAALGRLAQIPQGGREAVTVFAATEGIQRGAVGPLSDDEIAAGVVGVDEKVLSDAARYLPDLLRRSVP